jgi:hypothetical protein
MNAIPVCNRPGAQRGVSLVGLLVWAVMVGFIGYLLVRTVPPVNEFLTIQSTIDKIAAAPPATVGDIRNAFDRQREIEYSIHSITGKELEVSKENERVVIAFAYDKEVPIVGPVYILLKFRGRSK